MHSQRRFPFAAEPPQTSVDKSAFSTHVKISCICCRIGCALPAVSGDLEQCCGGGSMVWHAGEAISYTKPARSDMRSGVPGINVTLSASQGCWVISDSNQTFALVWQASVDVRKQQGHRAVHARFLHAMCRAHVQHSKTWWLGATLSTAIPVIYSFSGGMRASIMTDATQVCHLLAHSSNASLLASLLAEVCVSGDHVNRTACQRQTSASFQIAYHKGC